MKSIQYPVSTDQTYHRVPRVKVNNVMLL